MSILFCQIIIVYFITFCLFNRNNADENSNDVPSAESEENTCQDKMLPLHKCPEGINQCFNAKTKKCYYFDKDIPYLSRNTSKNICKKMSGSLFLPESNEELNYALKQGGKASGCNVGQSCKDNILPYWVDVAVLFTRENEETKVNPVFDKGTPEAETFIGSMMQTLNRKQTNVLYDVALETGGSKDGQLTVQNPGNTAGLACEANVQMTIGYGEYADYKKAADSGIMIIGSLVVASQTTQILLIAGLTLTGLLLVTGLVLLVIKLIRIIVGNKSKIEPQTSTSKPPTKKTKTEKITKKKNLTKKKKKEKSSKKSKASVDSDASSVSSSDDS